jgi:hypothetical protein
VSISNSVSNEVTCSKSDGKGDIVVERIVGRNTLIMKYGAGIRVNYSF